MLLFQESDARLSFCWIWGLCFIVVTNWHRNLNHVQANLIAVFFHYPHQGKKPKFLMKCRWHEFGKLVKMHLVITCIAHPFTMLPSSHWTLEGPAPILHFYDTYLKKFFSWFLFILPGGRNLIWSCFTHISSIWLLSINQLLDLIKWKYYVNFKKMHNQLYECLQGSHCSWHWKINAKVWETFTTILYLRLYSFFPVLYFFYQVGWLPNAPNVVILKWGMRGDCELSHKYLWEDSS